jgi:hypothetical protein
MEVQRDAPNMEFLKRWVEEKMLNGVLQHSNEWLRVKQFTIGGSSLATIMGLNPYSTIAKLISERIGLSKFNSDVKPQWGNLFEDIIKRYVEYDCSCLILGEDLYIGFTGTYFGTSYSPDGITVLEFPVAEHTEEIIICEKGSGGENVGRQITDRVRIVQQVPKYVLLEFKCPFSRIPNGKIPKYYVPQVKMGLQLMGLPTVGLFVEAVFRRCTWEQLGNNPEYDKILVPKSSGKFPLAYGIIGFYINEAKFTEYLGRLRVDPYKFTAEQIIAERTRMMSKYIDFFAEAGTEQNDFMCNDLGETPKELFETIMHAVDKKIITPWYGKILPTGSAQKSTAHIDLLLREKINIDSVNDDVATFTQYCKEWGLINIGILPWKLFRIDYHYMLPTPGYVDPWMPKINEVIQVVRDCISAPSTPKKLEIYSKYVGVKSNAGFSDDW